jgi:hypothetical protein
LAHSSRTGRPKQGMSWPLDNVLNQPSRQVKAHKSEVWRQSTGKIVEIRRWVQSIRIGHVDAVSADGMIVWVAGFSVETRALFEKCQGFQIWVPVHASRSLGC